MEEDEKCAHFPELLIGRYHQNVIDDVIDKMCVCVMSMCLEDFRDLQKNILCSKFTKGSL